MAVSNRPETRDLVLHRDRDQIPQDRALPGAAAIRSAATVGANHDEPGVGVELIHHVGVERIDHGDRVRPAVDLEEHRIPVVRIEGLRPRDGDELLPAADVDGLDLRGRRHPGSLSR